MPHRSIPQRSLDDAAFPVRVKLRVPEEGFGASLISMLRWLREELGEGNFARHGAGASGGGARGAAGGESGTAGGPLRPPRGGCNRGRSPRHLLLPDRGRARLPCSLSEGR